MTGIKRLSRRNGYGKPAITVRRHGRTSWLVTGAESFMTRAENMDGERLACLGPRLQPPPSLPWITVGGQVRQASQAVGAASAGRPLEPAARLDAGWCCEQDPQADHSLGSTGWACLPAGHRQIVRAVFHCPPRALAPAERHHLR